ncbi:MAG: class II fructose-bisphosphate aldolase [Chloroflexi bacterium]|nr:class II fructose-bisphosphate aldolase [Chloroflexota bacterium]
MPLVTGRALLDDAVRRGYAVAAFNAMALEVLQGVLDAAEQERAPIFVQFNPGNLRHLGLPFAAALARAAADEATVPVALHLDHGENYEQAVRCVRAGFTSLMYDGNNESFETNVAVTRRVVELGRAVGVTIEGELGRIAGREEEWDVAAEDAEMTDPAAAREYVERTGVDSLAVAVGNVHGLTARSADLDLGRLRALHEATSVPLVLHGASGIPDETVRTAIALGVVKFNVATQLNAAYLRAMAGAGEAAPQDLRTLLMAARREVAAAAADRIRVFGSSGRAAAL